MQPFTLHLYKITPIVAAILSIGTLTVSAKEAAQALGSTDVVGPFISQALENNAGLKAHDKRYLAALQSIDGAGGLPNPKLQLSHFIESIQTRTGPQRQALTLQQPIPWQGKLNRSKEIAQTKSDALWHAYAIQQFELVDQVSQQVLEIAYLNQALSITQQNTEILTRLETIVEDRVKAGGDLSDLLRLQVEIERAKDLASQQKTQRLSHTAKLQALLGRPANSKSIEILWQPPSPITTNSQAWLEAIKTRSPQIAMLRALESSQVARERLAHLAKRPDFSIGLNYIRTGKAFSANTSDSGKDPWALMVGVSLPIWKKTNNALAIEASLEKEALAAQIQDLELSLIAEGTAWIANLSNAESRIQRYETRLLPLARQAHEITESSYRSGKTSILDLIETDRALLSLETEYWRAAADAWLAHWKLASLSGGLWLE